MTSTFNPLAGGPCGSLAQAAVHLRRPFMPALVQAKIRACDRDDRYAEIAYFIDVRAVIDRLNVLLPGAWQDRYELIEERAPTDDNDERVLVYRCRLTVVGASYSDVGEGPDHKAAQSDALKRAAVHLGIGHCVYRMDTVRMFPGDGPHQLRSSRRVRFYLDEANHHWLRGRYRTWLTQRGVAEYGLPLDHGEAARSIVPELYPARFLPEVRKPGTANREGEDQATGGPDSAGRAKSEPTGPEPSPAEVPAEKLVSVPQPPSEPPASPAQRAALVEIARRGGYSLPTLELLARCVRSTMLERLDERGLHEVRAFLDSAVGGSVADQALAARINELQQDPESEPHPRERLAAWLLEHEEAAAAQQAA